MTNSCTIYTDIQQVPEKERIVILGNFDGLHKGHQKLFKKGRQLAEEKNLNVLVFTFFPQPQSYKDPNFKYLLSQEDKLNHFFDRGADEVLTLPFDNEISALSATEFIDNILNKTLKAKDLVVGYDYHFGYQAKGDIQLLKEYAENMDVHIIAPVLHKGVGVSSSRIRQLIKEGNVDEAEDMLGYPYCLCGEVVHGRAIGRTINFPTANIDYDHSLVLPITGVYSAIVFLKDFPEKKYHGVLNVGTRPTIDENPEVIIEVHILDFNEDIYGEFLCIEVHHFLRYIVKFNNLNELKEAIEGDVVETEAFFKGKSL